MRGLKATLVMVFTLTFLFSSGVAVGNWEPGDPNKMHFPQLPDPAGWDIRFDEYYVADDFQCSESGPLRDIHFWISKASAK